MIRKEISICYVLFFVGVLLIIYFLCVSVFYSTILKNNKLGGEDLKNYYYCCEKDEYLYI